MTFCSPRWAVPPPAPGAPAGPAPRLKDPHALRAGCAPFQSPLSVSPASHCASTPSNCVPEPRQNASPFRDLVRACTLSPACVPPPPGFWRLPATSEAGSDLRAPLERPLSRHRLPRALCSYLSPRTPAVTIVAMPCVPFARESFSPATLWVLGA